MDHDVTITRAAIDWTFVREVKGLQNTAAFNKNILLLQSARALQGRFGYRLTALSNRAEQ